MACCWLAMWSNAKVWGFWAGVNWMIGHTRSIWNIGLYDDTLHSLVSLCTKTWHGQLNWFIRASGHQLTRSKYKLVLCFFGCVIPTAGMTCPVRFLWIWAMPIIFFFSFQHSMKQKRYSPLWDSSICLKFYLSLNIVVYTHWTMHSLDSTKYDTPIANITWDFPRLILPIISARFQMWGFFTPQSVGANSIQ